MNENKGIQMKSLTLNIKTNTHTEMQEITDRVQEAVSDSCIENGIRMLFVPHTTAAVTINENADPDVVRDFIMELDKIIPWDDGYHHFEGNSAAHLKASIIGFSEHIIVENGCLQLGTWQGIYFCEYDGPRSRQLKIKIMED